jgi:hypothetical protein
MRTSMICASLTLALLMAAQGAATQPPAPPRKAPASAVPSIEIFPGATLDPEETAVLADGATGRSGIEVYRTPGDFGVVVNYYRFKRKQPVHIVQEDVGERFRRTAALLDMPTAPAALLEDPFVRRFHLYALGTATPERRTAADAWRKYAKRFEGKQQRIGEGTRVTVFRPYLSPRTFTLIDETVIVVRRSGGTQTW